MTAESAVPGTSAQSPSTYQDLSPASGCSSSDRASGEHIIQIAPESAISLSSSVGEDRMIRWLAQEWGLDCHVDGQYGLPAGDTANAIAQRRNPTARVVAGMFSMNGRKA